MIHRTLTGILLLSFVISEVAYAQTQPRVFITEPLNGSSIEKGAVLRVTVKVEPTDTPIRQIVISGSPGVTGILRGTDRPFTFDIPIGETVALGTRTIVAAAFLQDGEVLQSEKIVVVVEPAEVPTLIEARPDSMSLGFRGKSSQINVIGTFTNGSRITVNGSKLLEMTSSNPQVAIVENNKRIVAVGPGATNIQVRMGRATSNVAVQVLKSTRGDFDGDGDINSTDVQYLSLWRNTIAVTTGDDRDLNTDGKIDALDLAILRTLCVHPEECNVAVPSDDTTGPVIFPQIVGNFGNHEWYTSDVTINWQVTDPESGIASSSGCAQSSLTADTASATLTCSATNGSGLSTSMPLVFKIDKTAPIATAARSPNANSAGWNNTDVIVSFIGTDLLSGVNSCTGPTTLLGNGASQSAIGTCEDQAGNVSTPATISGINIDKIPPVLTPPPNQIVQQTAPTGTVVSYPALALTDGSSGAASSNCLPASGSLFPVGITTVNCTGKDRADNISTATFTVTVNPNNSSSDGRMYGVGFINRGVQHQHFVFRVAQIQNRDYGRLEYWIGDPRLCRGDDDYDHDLGFNGDHDGDYGRDHHKPQSHFEATSFDTIEFSDDPRSSPGGKPSSSVDTALARGSGKWNGKSGYTFEMNATDKGEPGRQRDAFSLTIKDSRGATVDSVNGIIDGGNIQSTRLGR